jgi:NADP-dependent 3-hydroxy acid dehydrogenase YdfG
MGKIAFITGATAGIGEATAHKLASQGWNLILTGRRKDRLESLAGVLKQTHGIDTFILQFDIRNAAACNSAWGNLPETWQIVDLLVNNAGLAAGRGPVQEGNPDDWEQMIDTNLKGLLYITRLVSPGMVARKHGHIINIGSVAGREAYPGGNVYCATKFAVEGLSRCMRIDLAPHQVRVTTISPGMVETEFSLVRFKGDADKAKEVYQGIEPLVAQDIAEAISWAVHQPERVCINDIYLTCTAQPNANISFRKG